MDDLLGGKPFMSPVAIASSSKRSFSDTECSTSSDSVTDEKPKHSKLLIITFDIIYLNYLI